METLLYNISQVLGITIIHSLWQGLLIYFMLRIVLLFSAQLLASKKYLLALTSLVAITGWLVYTLFTEIAIYNWLAVKPATLLAMPLILELPAGVGRFNDQTIRYYYSIEEYLPYITGIYIIGLLFNTGKLVLGRCKINQIKQSMSIDINLQRRLDKFTEMLGIDFKINVGLSELVDVPCMIGYFKPIILLPFTLSTYLGAEEIESILLHELAHIKRNDYLVNMAQQVVSILLFFNPCAQLINRIINEERENSCDDLVVRATPNPIIYAKALLKLEQTRENNMKLAMAATGKKYQLLSRIERIMKTKKPAASIRPALLAMLIITIGIGSIALLNPEIAKGKISVKALAPVINQIISDTTHKKNPAKHNTTTLVKRAVNLRVDHHDYIDLGEQYYGGVKDKKLEILSAEIGKYSDEIGNYYENPEFKKLQEDIEAKGKAIESFYSRPELHKLLTEQLQYSEDYNKSFAQTDQMKQLNKQMEDAGKKITAYYNSAEFTAIKRKIEQKNDLHNQLFNTRDTMYAGPHYRNFSTALYGKIPEDIKYQQREESRLSKEIVNRYNTPEIKQKAERLRVVSDSLKEAYDNAHLRQQQIAMGKLSAQLSVYQNNAAVKLKQKALNDLSKKMADYVKSVEFKKHLQESGSNSGVNWKKADQPERSEQPEKPQQQEKPESPEAKN